MSDNKNEAGGDDEVQSPVEAAAAKAVAKALSPAERRAQGKRIIDAQHPPQTVLTPTQIRDHFRTRDKALAEEALGPLAKQFEQVEKLLQERNQLKATVAEQQIELDELKSKVAKLISAA